MIYRGGKDKKNGIYRSLTYDTLYRTDNKMTIRGSKFEATLIKNHPCKKLFMHFCCFVHQNPFKNHKTANKNELIYVLPFSVLTIGNLGCSVYQD